MSTVLGTRLWTQPDPPPYSELKSGLTRVFMQQREEECLMPGLQEILVFWVFHQIGVLETQTSEVDDISETQSE